MRGSAQRSGPGGDDHPSSPQPGGCESDSETRGRGGASGIDRRNQMAPNGDLLMRCLTFVRQEQLLCTSLA